jgi:DNA replication and repair protein RecF
MVVTGLELRDFRSYERLSLELSPGLVLIVGANGAGKTNLLEAVHLGTQGFSFRTRRDGSAVRFDRDAARVSLAGLGEQDVRFTTSVVLDRSGAKRYELNGAATESQVLLRRELPVLAFTPDRLVVVKGGPLVRRMYLDRILGRLWPARAGLPAEYGQALAQRNAALRRVAAGLSGLEALEPWDGPVASLGLELDEARAESVRALSSFFEAEATRVGLEGARLSYERSSVSVEELAASRSRDLERGTTGAGPHLQDMAIEAFGTDLRTFGSQGQQRLGVLSLLLAEARAVADVRGQHPVLLLDDAMSELDDQRGKLVLEGIPAGAQVLVTATSERALSPDAPSPSQIVDVARGQARSR